MKPSPRSLQAMLAGPGGLQEELLARRLDGQERRRQQEMERNVIWLLDQQQHWQPETSQGLIGSPVSLSSSSSSSSAQPQA